MRLADGDALARTGVAMPIQVDAYTAGGMVRGLTSRSGHLREIMQTDGELALERASWQGLGDATARPAGEVTFPIDDVLVAIGDDDPNGPVHASWHEIHLELGPYAIDGELPTLPGYDPGRALTRPTGEFVQLRDVRLSLLSEPSRGATPGHYALVNLYGVDLVRADIMLGFYFPGATLDGVPEGSAAAPTA